MYSCKPVVSVEPVGYESVAADSLSWEGVWKQTNDGEKQVLYIKVINPKEGILDVKLIDNNNTDEDNPKEVKFKAILKKGDKYNYINVLYGEILNKKDIDEKYKNTYLWGTIKKSKNKIIINYPDDHSFEEFINKKKLNGRINNDIIILNESSSTITNFIERKSFELIFDSDSLIFERSID